MTPADTGQVSPGTAKGTGVATEAPGAAGTPEPTREEVNSMKGPVLLEFGAHWCGHCQELRPHLAAMLARFPGIRHIIVEDGRGKPLGRSFHVKLWPTLVFMRDGQVVQQISRPSPEEVREGLESMQAGGPSTASV